MAEENTRESRICYEREFLLSLAQLETCKNVPADFDASILRGIEDDSTCIVQSSRKADNGRHYINYSHYSGPKPVHDGVLGSGALGVCACEAVSPTPSSQNIGSLLKKSNEPYCPPHRNKIARKADPKRESIGSNDETVDAHKISSQERTDEKETTGLSSVCHGSQCPQDDSSVQSSLYSRSSDSDQSSFSSKSTDSDQSYRSASRTLPTVGSSNYFPEKNDRKTTPLFDISNAKPDNIKWAALCSSDSIYRGPKATENTELDKTSKMYSGYGETPESKKFRKCQRSFDEFCLPDENCLITTNELKSSKIGPFMTCLAIDIAEELLASADSFKENDMLLRSDLTGFETDPNIWNQPFYLWLREAYLDSERVHYHLDSPNTCLFEEKSSLLFSSADALPRPVQRCNNLSKMEQHGNHPSMLKLPVQKPGPFRSRGELQIDSILPPVLSMMESSPLQNFYRFYEQHGLFGS